MADFGWGDLFSVGGSIYNAYTKNKNETQANDIAKQSIPGATQEQSQWANMMNQGNSSWANDQNLSNADWANQQNRANQDYSFAQNQSGMQWANDLNRQNQDYALGQNQQALSTSNDMNRANQDYAYGKNQESLDYTNAQNRGNQDYAFLQNQQGLDYANAQNRDNASWVNSQNMANTGAINDMNMGNAREAYNTTQAGYDKTLAGNRANQSSAFGDLTWKQGPDGQWSQNIALNGTDQAGVDAMGNKRNSMIGGLGGGYDTNSAVLAALRAQTAPETARQAEAAQARAAAMGMGWGSGKGAETLQTQLDQSANDMEQKNVLAGFNADQALRASNRADLTTMDALTSGIKNRSEMPTYAQGQSATMTAPQASTPQMGSITQNAAQMNAVTSAANRMGSVNTNAAQMNGIDTGSATMGSPNVTAPQVQANTITTPTEGGINWGGGALTPSGGQQGWADAAKTYTQPAPSADGGWAGGGLGASAAAGATGMTPGTTGEFKQSPYDVTNDAQGNPQSLGAAWNAGANEISGHLQNWAAGLGIPASAVQMAMSMLPGASAAQLMSFLSSGSADSGITNRTGGTGPNTTGYGGYGSADSGNSNYSRYGGSQNSSD